MKALMFSFFTLGLFSQSAGAAWSDQSLPGETQKLAVLSLELTP